VRRVLVVCAILAAFATSLRAQSIPVGPGGELSSLVGQRVDVPIVVDMSGRPELLGSFAMRLTWNPAVLQFDGGFSGNFGSVTVNADSAAQGIVRIAGANPSGIGGAVTVGVSSFTPLTSDTTTLGLGVTELFAAGSFADLLSAVLPGNGFFCPARGRYGDIDADNNANSRDALIALSNAVGLPVGNFDIGLGDVDADGNTNARDALIILSASVGLDVSAYRVLTLAGGACSTGIPLAFAVVPGTIGDVVVGQTIQFQAQATDQNGVPQTVTGAGWLVSDSRVLGVLSTGQAIARDTGTADVMAIRNGRDTARVSVHVVARRRTHIVSAAALNAGNRLGTAALPFADLSEVDPVLNPGDTIRMRPGTYPGGAFLRYNVVLIGERSGPNTAVISGRGGYVGLMLSGTGVGEVHDVTIDGFQTGLQITTVDTVVVDSLRVIANGGPTSCYTAGIQVQSAWLVWIRRSQVVGDGASTGCADGIQINGPVQTAVIEDVTLNDLGYTGITAYGTDSLVLRRVVATDLGAYGVDVSLSGGCGHNCAPPAGAPGAGPRRGPALSPISTAVVIDSSRFQRMNYTGVYLEDVRSAIVAHSLVDAGPYADGLEVYAAYGPAGSYTGYLRLVGDSIVTNDYDWLYANYLDSVVVDSTRIVGAYGGDIYESGLVRVTNSSFDQITRGSAVYIDGWPKVTNVFMDSVSFRGSPQYDRYIEGVEAYSARGTLNRINVDNADYGIDAGDSSFTVTNSAMTNTWDGVYLYSESYGPQRMVVRNVSLTDSYYGVEISDAPAVVESVTVVRSDHGIYLSGVGVDTVRNNVITSNFDTGIESYDTVAVVTGNVLTDLTYNGIIVTSWGYLPTVTDSAVVVNNQVACRPNGYGDTGIRSQYLHARIQGNTVSGGCAYGVFLDNSDGYGVGALVRGNTVTLDPATVHTGIRVDAGWHARVVGNLVTGGRDEGSIRVGSTAPYYSPLYAPWVLVDSNTVQNGAYWGIRAEWVDTLEVRGNLVEDVASPLCCYGPNPGAIAVGQVRTMGRVAGNTVRRSAGAGIAVDQQEYNYHPFDTATIFVDSNAVSVSDTAAVRMGNGLLSMRHNNIRNNVRDGVFFLYSNGTHILRDNAFQGNGLYAVNNGADGSVDADTNWWGVDAMPPGAPGTDSALIANDNAPLSASPANLLPPAPPVFRPAAPLAALRATAPTAAASATQGPRPARAARPSPAPRAAEARRTLPGERGQVQATRAAAAATRAREREVRRQALEAQRAARDSTVAARLAQSQQRTEERR